MDKYRILFVCTYYGGRVRIAELLAKQTGLQQVSVSSSGFESGSIEGLPKMVMEEAGFNFSSAPLVTVFERYANREMFDCVITMCHEGSTEQCPVFRESVDMVYGNNAEMIAWSIPDFIALQGLPEEKLEGARNIRDMISAKVSDLVSQI